MYSAIILGIDDERTGLPTEFILSQNHPNPFDPTTTLRYNFPERVDVTVTIYDILGSRVRTIVQDVEETGCKSVVWDGTNDIGQRMGAGV